ncbi:hypothetical protein [Brevundimonas sp.]|uniref:hypothetical protein n=1 Tax=Brevundimonas sp. TaxID=1871086 RepID=UPI00272FAADC|nr:hypothetical protein [Brevundimonas sp.]MDP1911860.1 hypothetical protein [Brevundimonas sp.]
MTDWIKASNPTAPINTEAEAIGAARASAIAIFLGVVWGAIGVALLMTGGSAEIEAAMAQASADTPEMAGMGEMAMQIALWSAIGISAIQLVLGLVQWSKPNVVIPIIFAILVAFGLVSGLFGMMMAGQAGMPETAAAPTWQVYVGFVILVIQLVMHIAGIRGARALDKLRMAAAQ